jgi:hypothetical protein
MTGVSKFRLSFRFSFSLLVIIYFDIHELNFMYHFGFLGIFTKLSVLVDEINTMWYF